MADPIRVSILSSFVQGGAAKAALRLHEGLRRQGVECRYVTRNDTDTDRGISCANQLTQSFGNRLAEKLRRLLIPGSFEEGDRRIATVPKADIFNDCRNTFGKRLNDDFADCDVLNLHWISHFIDLPTFIHSVAGRVPLVWTLHDMHALTGGCHYDAGCGKFSLHCGSCPQLAISGTYDASAVIFGSREHALARLSNNDLHLVTPSHWLNREVSKSQLLKRFPRTTIPNGLDENVFFPMSRHAAVNGLSIPNAFPRVLFVADSVTNYRKGMDLLLAALPKIASQFPKVRLISVGGGKIPNEFLDGISHTHLGIVGNENFMRLVYSAANLFVVPSREDNLPNTVLESMACGTPSVGFDVGGISDMIRPGVNGWLAPQISEASLADTMCKALLSLQNRDREVEMRLRCRRVVEAEYTLQIQAQRYHALFENLVRRKSAVAPTINTIEQ